MERLINLLETIKTVNEVLLMIHRLPILARINKEIEREIERTRKNENQIQKTQSRRRHSRKGN